LLSFAILNSEYYALNKQKFAEEVLMSIHGHEVLRMMEGNNYTESSLFNAIKNKFGENAVFHTCSKSNMNAEQLIAFLKAKGKFKPSVAHKSEFTVDNKKICKH
jgi:probable metal-binding protein